MRGRGDVVGGLGVFLEDVCSGGLVVIVLFSSVDILNARAHLRVHIDGCHVGLRLIDCFGGHLIQEI